MRDLSLVETDPRVVELFNRTVESICSPHKENISETYGPYIDVTELPYHGRYGIEPERDIEILSGSPGSWRWTRIPKEKCKVHFTGNLAYHNGILNGNALPSMWRLVESV